MAGRTVGNRTHMAWKQRGTLFNATKETSSRAVGGWAGL